MIENEFDIVLSSQAFLNIYKNNNPGSFRNLFNKRQFLTGDWSVSLKQVAIPITWACELDIEIKFFCPELLTFVEQTINTTFEWNDNTMELLEHLNDVVQQEAFDKPMNFSLDPSTGFVVITPAEALIADHSGGRSITIFPEFDNATFIKLGLHKLQTSKYEIRGYKSIDPTRGEVLLVETNIVEPFQVGDKDKKLLNYVSTNNRVRYGDVLFYRFDFADKRKVQTKSSDSIEINIKNILGKTLSFSFGESLITLHFERDAY